MTTEIPVDLPEDVEAALLARGPSLGGHELILLPNETRDGRTYFQEEDIDALDLARDDGIDAVFLHDAESRRFLHENSAGWELVGSIAIAEGLATTAISALIRYLYNRVRHAKKLGLYEGEESAATLRLTVAQVRRDGVSGDITAQAVQLEGDLDGVTSTLRRLLGDEEG